MSAFREERKNGPLTQDDKVDNLERLLRQKLESVRRTRACCANWKGNRAHRRCNCAGRSRALLDQKLRP